MPIARVLLQWVRQSLQLRVVISIALIYFVVVWSAFVYLTANLKGDIQAMLMEQQASTAIYLAAQINEKLTTRLRVLQRMADRIHLSSAEELPQTTLEHFPAISELFNGGAFLTDIHGNAIASVPASTQRVGINYMDRPSIKEALLNGTPSIGSPVIGRSLNVPVFTMAVPVHDHAGRVTGALVGVTNLTLTNFLETHVQEGYGLTGYFLVCDRNSRSIITSSDRTRVMEKLPPQGKNPLIDRYMAGQDGTGVTMSPRGIEVLASARSVPVANWYVVVALPTAEAFRPVHEMQRKLLLVFAGIALVGGLLSWWVIRRQLAPMREALQVLRANLTSKPSRLLPITHQDELGELLHGFNQLLEQFMQKEQTLQASEKKLATILDNVDAYIYLKDPLGRYLFANRRVRELFGKREHEIVGQGDEAFFDAATVRQIRENDSIVLREGRMLKAEETNLSLRDNTASTYLSVKLPLWDERGQVYALCGISTDISERKQMEEQIRRQALHDSLTSLPNRRLLSDRMEHAMAASKRSGIYCALLFIDLDNFKSLNDTHGHEVGDLLLMEVAHRLVHCVREADTVARLGGDEFVVMISELSHDRATSVDLVTQVARKILDTLRIPYLLDGRAGESTATIKHVCTASLGIYLFLGDQESIHDILQGADKAMYLAKQEGKDALHVL